jgi:SAM-dependent methyltransferase
MTLDNAITHIAKVFPHQPYVIDASRQSWRFIATWAQRFVQPGGSILDFGSGPADAAAVLAKLGYEVHACDDLQDAWHLLPGMREKVLRFAKEEGVQFAVVDHNTPLPYHEKQFDMIVMHHVLEHIGDSPKDLLNTLVGMLKDNGLLMIAVPSAVNIRKRIDVLLGKTNYPPFDQFFWMEGTWRGHRREYCRRDLEMLCEYLGVRPEVLTTYHFMLHRIPGPAQGLYKAVTSVIPGWRDSWILIARKPAGWKPRVEVPSGMAWTKSVHLTGTRGG